jgi:hypothetical protein
VASRKHAFSARGGVQKVTFWAPGDLFFDLFHLRTEGKQGPTGARQGGCSGNHLGQNLSGELENVKICQKIGFLGPKSEFFGISGVSGVTFFTFS